MQEVYMKYLLLLICFLSAPLFSEEARPKVGLCIMATGRYNLYIKPLIQSARRHFCKSCDVTYFVFTDGPFEKTGDLVGVYQMRLGWPYDTLKRFHVYYANKELFKEMDYVYAIDADMLFLLPVDREILSDVVGTRHFGYTAQRGTYETNPISRACVLPHEGTYYYAGAFYGGKRASFFKLLETVIDQVDDDLGRHFIALWHDESHLNRYFIDHPPTLMLPIEYCFPESWHWPAKKIITLDKNNDEMRTALREDDVIDPNLWWEKSLKKNPHLINDFASWWGDENALSRVRARKHIKLKQYTSILDAGCGFAHDYFGFFHENTPIDYLGIDVSPSLASRARQSGAPVNQGNINAMPEFSKGQFDVVYVRHLLEHSEQPETMIKELLRVAKRELLIVFFIKPVPMENDISSASFNFGYFLYHTTLSKTKLEKFLLSEPRVESLDWEDVGDREVILHIYLKN
jgi:histo-blood group ABO system transferase